MGTGAAGAGDRSGSGAGVSPASQYLLDTSFLIDVMRGDPGAQQRLERLWSEAEAIYVNEIVVCELFTGLRDPDVKKGRTLVQPLEFVQPGPETALLAGRWRSQAQQQGRTLSLADALIAATAESLGAAVLTRNLRDFALTPASIESY